MQATCAVLRPVELAAGFNWERNIMKTGYIITTKIPNKATRNRRWFCQERKSCQCNAIQIGQLKTSVIGSACVAVPVTDGIIFFWSSRQGSLGSFSLCLTTSPEVIFDRLESRIPPLLPGNIITGQTILFMVVFQKGAVGMHLIHIVAKILEFFALLEFSPWTDSALWV